jgi:hypothetical protein
MVYIGSVIIYYCFDSRGHNSRFHIEIACLAASHEPILSQEVISSKRFARAEMLHESIVTGAQP